MNNIAEARITEVGVIVSPETSPFLPPLLLLVSLWRRTRHSDAHER
jgi:hypothetical protein